MSVNNFVCIRGTLGRDPELKYSAAGKPYMIFSLATRRDKKDKNGQYGTDWINCVCFNRAAEEIGLQGQKGSVIAVYGTLQTNSYVDKSGAKRSSMQVVVDDAYVLKNYIQKDGMIYADVTLPKNPQTPASAGMGSSSSNDRYDDIEADYNSPDFPFF